MSSKKSNIRESAENSTTTDGENCSINKTLEMQSPNDEAMINTKNNSINETNRPGDDGEATDKNNTITNEQPSSENETGEPAADQNIAAAWTEAWDDQSQAYYWWNTITYETAWENPNDTSAALETTSSQQPRQQQEQQLLPERNELDSVLDTIDTQVRAKLDGPSTTTQSYQQSSSSSLSTDTTYPYHSPSDSNLGATDPYRFQAFFNTKTGRFQNSSDLAQRHPDQYTMEARAKRQMEHYFDVEAYQAQRNQQLEQGRKRSLSRKEVDRFKRAKKEKKANRMREWLRD